MAVDESNAASFFAGPAPHDTLNHFIVRLSRLFGYGSFILVTMLLIWILT